MSTHLPHHLAALLITLSACAPSDGGQVGEETIGCLPVETQSLTLDETSPLGFSPMQVLDLVDGSHSAPLTWADGSETLLTTSFSYASVANYQDREWVDDNNSGGPEPAPADAGDCPDIVELSMTVTVQSDDGALNETWTVALQAVSADSSSFYQTLESTAGTLDIDSYAPAGDFDSKRAFLDFSITEAGISGKITGQAEGTDGDVAFAQNFDIASFGPPPAT